VYNKTIHTSHFIQYCTGLQQLARKPALPTFH